MAVSFRSRIPAGFDPPARYQFEFIERRQETPTTASFRFSTEGTRFVYRSNQAVRVILPGVRDPWGPARTFSLSSSPSEEGVAQISVKLTDSPYKTALNALEPGSRVVALGPVGDLLYDRSRDSLFIAGGIGVSPFRGMIRYAYDLGEHPKIVLLYSARTAEEFAFKSEIDKLSEADPKIEVRYTITRPKESRQLWEGRVGRFDETTIRAGLKNLHHPKVFVVGTPEMALATLDLLRLRMGVVEDDLEYEFFRGY